MASLRGTPQRLQIGWRRLRRAHPLDERTWQLHRLLAATNDPEARRTLTEEIAHLGRWRAADVTAARTAARRARQAFLHERWRSTPIWVRLLAALALPLAGALLVAATIGNSETAVVAQGLTSAVDDTAAPTTNPGASTAPTVLGATVAPLPDGGTTSPSTATTQARPRPMLGLLWSFSTTTAPVGTPPQPTSPTTRPTTTTPSTRPPRPTTTTTEEPTTTTTEEPTTTTEATTTTTEPTTTTTTEDPTTTTEPPP